MLSVFIFCSSCAGEPKCSEGGEDGGDDVFSGFQGKAVVVHHKELLKALAEGDVFSFTLGKRLSQDVSSSEVERSVKHISSHICGGVVKSVLSSAKNQDDTSQSDIVLSKSGCACSPKDKEISSSYPVASEDDKVATKLGWACTLKDNDVLKSDPVSFKDNKEESVSARFLDYVSFTSAKGNFDHMVRVYGDRGTLPSFFVAGEGLVLENVVFMSEAQDSSITFIKIRVGKHDMGARIHRSFPSGTKVVVLRDGDDVIYKVEAVLVQQN